MLSLREWLHICTHRSKQRCINFNDSAKKCKTTLSEEETEREKKRDRARDETGVKIGLSFTGWRDQEGHDEAL